MQVGVIWEFYEFTSDKILGTNMQKFELQDKTKLVGQDALRDTMEDLIVDVLGAVVASVVGYFSIKYKKGWLEDFRIKFKGETYNE